MDDISVIKDMVLSNKPIITLGDEINIGGILGEDSTNSTIANDDFNLMRKNDVSDQNEDFKFHTHYDVDDYVPRVSSDFAAKYELLARSVTECSEPMPVSITIAKGCLTCPICGKTFPSPKFLTRHLHKHSARFTCPHCHKVFGRKESKLKHLPKCKVIHPKEKTRQPRKTQKFTCEECGQEYSRKENYEQHMWKHRGVSFVCEICQKTYTTVKSWKAHQKLHDDMREVFFCEHCSKAFLFKSNLRRHIRKLSHINRIHCEKCKRIMKTEKMLATHKKTTAIKCVLCPLLFCTEKDMKDHRLSTHPSLWFTCKMCGNPTTRFMTRSEQHLKEHTQKSHQVFLTFNNCYEQGWYIAFD